MKRIKKKNGKTTADKKLSALDYARIKKQEMKDSGIDVVQKNPMEKWELNKTSLRASINAMCYDCNGGENYRSRIKFCDIPTCPLWNVRPYAKGITLEQCQNHEDVSL